MNNHRLTLSTALVTTVVGATFVVGAPPVSAGGYPPTLNCLANVCTILHNDAADRDGDGFTDADEKLFGSDPNDPTSCPPVRWVFDRIADATLPGFWLEPSIGLVTISPDGHVVTETLIDAMAGLGLTLHERAGNFGLTLSPAGIDLGTIGGSLDWQIHGETTSTAPPANPRDASLYGRTGDPPSDAKVNLDGGYAFVQNSFTFGVASSTVHIHSSDGTLMGSGFATGADPWKTQAEATKKATDKATAEAAAAIAKAIEVETKRLAAEEAKRVADKEAADRAAAAAADAAAKKAAEAAAKKKSEEEGKDHTPTTPAAADKDHKGLTNPDAEMPIDPQHLTPKQVASLVAAGSGSYYANVGDTGVIAMFTPGEYVDPTIFIVHIDPDADQPTASAGPDLDNQAGPEYDPNLPVIDTNGNPVRPPGEPPH